MVGFHLFFSVEAILDTVLTQNALKRIYRQKINPPLIQINSGFMFKSNVYA